MDNEQNSTQHEDEDSSELLNASLLSSSSGEINNRRDPYLALRFRNFRLLFIGTSIATIGEQMVNVAIGWELYERTGSSLALGFVGLVQVTPTLLLSLPAGYLADRFERKPMLLITLLIIMSASLGLTLLSIFHGPVLLIYGCLLIFGIGAALNNPASSALLSQTVPETAYTSAATWKSSAGQLASVIGPALGGLVIAISGSSLFVYALNVGAILTFAFLVVLLHTQPRVTTISSETTALKSLLEGVNFVRRTQVILAAITLDLFAVLLGGATTLLPVFARDILRVGPTGLGILRAAPSIGALCVALCIAHMPPFKHAGRTLLLAVAGFGLATVIFGISHYFWLSLLMLFLLGGLDSISVVIRHTLLLLYAPDAMRGRVSAVNNIFVGASNELGGFESGLVAQLLGPVLSVVAGGIGTMLVVLLVALFSTEMRRLRSLHPEHKT